MSQLFQTFIVDYEKEAQRHIENEVESEAEAQLVDIDADAYISKLLDQKKLTKLTINWDELKPAGYREVDSYEHDSYYGSQSVKRTLFKFRVPYTGSGLLFQLHSDYFKRTSQEFNITSRDLEFELEGTGSPNTDQAMLSRLKDIVSSNVNGLNGYVDTFNSGIEEYASKVVTDRQQRIAKNQSGFASFGLSVAEPEE